MESTRLLQQAQEQTNQVIKIAQEQFLSLSEKQLSQKPAADKWSIAECLEHLNYYSSYYNNEIKKAIQRAEQKQWKTTPNFSSTWLGKKSIEMANPDNSKPLKAAKNLNPAFSKVEPDVVKRFLKHQNDLLALIKAAHQVNLNKAKIRMEIMKLLKLRLGDIFLFMTAHQLRHCNQALNVLKVTNGVCS